ncbi:unnamed protein product, partial [Didymodactylos carnosus]
KQSLIDVMIPLNFNHKGIILSKEIVESIYKSIYDEIELLNGFTQYSIEQIECFITLEEFVNEKLVLVKDTLQSMIYEQIENEIKKIYDSELPDLYSCRIHFVLNNLTIIKNIQEKFNQENQWTSIGIRKLDFKKFITDTTLKEINEELLKKNRDNIMFNFYKVLTRFDFLLIQITKREFNDSNKNSI